MTATVVHSPHRCDLPLNCVTPEGVIVRCDDCGKTWESRTEVDGRAYWQTLGWLARRRRGLR